MTTGASSDKSKPETFTVPVVEERAVLLSKPKDGAAVRIDKEVRERVVAVEAIVRDEEVVVERLVLDRPLPVDAPPGVRQEGDVTVIPILEERLVLAKQLFVREELHVRRIRRSRVAREQVTLRSEDVRIDRRRASQHAMDPDRSSSKQPEEHEMERVLVGVFESKAQSEAARRELCDCGIAEDRITVRSDGRDDQASASRALDDDGHVGFFGRLFGMIEGRESQSSLYSEAVDRGNCVVVVDGIPDDRVDEAVSVLQRNGAIDIDERASQWRGEESIAPQTGVSAGASARTSTGASAQMQAESRPQTQQAGGQAATRIPVVEEQLQVGKREVQRGGVRVYTRTTERPVQQDVTLKEEHVRVERRPVDRPATESELGKAFEEKSVELRETAEEPVVAKTAHVVEEVHVGKELTERTERVQDTVRRTDVQVEDLQGRASRGAVDDRASGSAMAATTGMAATAGMTGRVDGIDVDDLNGLLRDELSAVETYRQALDKNRAQYGQDARFQQLVHLLHNHEQAATKLRQLIREAGGTESNDSGAWGTWANTVMGTAKLFGDTAALKALKEGEESGIKDYRSLLDDDDVPAAAREILVPIVEQQKQHIAVLDRLIDAA